MRHLRGSDSPSLELEGELGHAIASGAAAAAGRKDRVLAADSGALAVARLEPVQMRSLDRHRCYPARASHALAAAGAARSGTDAFVDDRASSQSAS